MGKSYEAEVFNRLKKMGFLVFNHGFEKIHPRLHQYLINSNDPTSKLNRYQPDHLALEKLVMNTCFVEVKFSDSIEKGPYLNYQKLHQVNQCKLLMCIKSSSTEKEYWMPIEHLKLISGKESILNFPPYRRFPIDDDDWIVPRQLRDDKSQFSYYKRQKYYNYQHKNLASGTPHRYIDFEKLESFKNWVLYPHFIKEWVSDRQIFMNVLIEKKPS